MSFCGYCPTPDSILQKFSIIGLHNIFYPKTPPVGAAIGRPEDIPLNENGKIVQQCIEEIPLHYPVVSVDEYVIMPNHIHLLLQINTDGDGRPTAAPTISTIINQTKGIISKRIGFPVWQKGFYDHVVRGEKEYLEIWNYIDGNPHKRETDV